ncbi:MAG: ATP-binding protein [Planctomycetes bacterium]|nr:ATP-binding protein [Planctomycetota bacterium]
MEDLSLYILDIAENSINGAAGTIEIIIDEDRDKDLLTIEIKDDGKGMDDKTVKKALDPFFTTRKTRKVGLELSGKPGAGRSELSKIRGATARVWIGFELGLFLALLGLNWVCFGFNWV